MENKFVLLLIFASVGQGSFVPTMTVSYGLSQEQVAVLNQIIVNQESALRIYLDRYTNLFKIFYNLESTIYGSASKISEILSGVAEVGDLFFDSVRLALNGSCAAVDDARRASDAYLDDAAVHITAAFRLARSKYHPKNQAAIKIHQTAVQQDFTNSVENFYDLVGDCLACSNDEVIAVIEQARQGSRVSMLHVANAIFNAIKLYPSGEAAMKDFKDKSLARIIDGIESKFSLLRALFIYYQLNQTGIATELAVIQRTLTVSYRKYADGNAALFNPIKDYLTRLYVGLDDDGDLDFSWNDLALRTVITKYDIGDSLNLVPLLVILPNSCADVAIARKGLADLDDFAVNVYFDLIYTAAAVEANYSDTMNYIRTRRGNVYAGAVQYSGYYFDIIRNSQIWDDEITAKLTYLQNKTTDAVVYLTLKFFDAVEILANATYIGKAYKKDFSMVQTYLEEANSGYNDFVQALSAASTTILRANNVG